MSGRVGLSRKFPPKRKTNEDVKRDEDSFKSPRVELVQRSARPVFTPPVKISSGIAEVPVQPAVTKKNVEATITGEFPDSPPLDGMLDSPERKAEFDDDFPLSPIVGYRYGSDGEVLKPSAWGKAEDGGNKDEADFGSKEEQKENQEMAVQLPLDPNVSKLIHEGFTTASGKPVKVSEAALRKVKAMFDPDEVQLLTKPLCNQPSSSTQSNTSTSEDKEVMECIEAFLMDGDDF